MTKFRKLIYVHVFTITIFFERNQQNVKKHLLKKLEKEDKNQKYDYCDLLE